MDIKVNNITPTANDEIVAKRDIVGYNVSSTTISIGNNDDSIIISSDDTSVQVGPYSAAIVSPYGFNIDVDYDNITLRITCQEVLDIFII